MKNRIKEKSEEEKQVHVLLADICKRASKSTDASERFRAVEVLARLSIVIESTILKTLFQRMMDEDELVRTSAVAGIGDYGAVADDIGRAMRRRLLRLLQHDESCLVRDNVALTLAQINDYKAIPLLKKLLLKPSTEEFDRPYLAYTLMSLGELQYWTPFIEGLTSEYPTVRLFVASQVVEVVPHESVCDASKRLYEALNCETRNYIRQEIESALAVLKKIEP